MTRLMAAIIVVGSIAILTAIALKVASQAHDAYLITHQPITIDEP